MESHHRPRRGLSLSLARARQTMWVKLESLKPCAVVNLRYDVQLDDYDIQLTMVGTAVALEPAPPEEDPESRAAAQVPHLLAPPAASIPQRVTPVPLTPFEQKTQYAHITPLSRIPGAIVRQHMGNISVYLVKETTSLRDQGGLAGFLQTFACEIQAVARAQVLSRGANALLAYRIQECVLVKLAGKNQGQCLLALTGDAVQVELWRIIIPGTRIMTAPHPLKNVGWPFPVALAYLVSHTIVGVPHTPLSLAYGGLPVKIEYLAEEKIESLGPTALLERPSSPQSPPNPGRRSPQRPRPDLSPLPLGALVSRQTSEAKSPMAIKSPRLAAPRGRASPLLRAAASPTLPGGAGEGGGEGSGTLATSPPPQGSPVRGQPRVLAMSEV